MQLIAVFSAIYILGCLSFFQMAQAASPPIEVNPHTGLAISGFDPVAYFTDGKAIIGRPDLEFHYAGTVWRFRNEGNRAAFAGHPEIYMPRFGGYDPVAIMRGQSVPGHPLLWAIIEQQVYFFYDEKARADFLKNPGSIIELAVRNWPKVSNDIPR